MTSPHRSMMKRMHGLMFRLPLMITCSAFEDFILAYLEDELPPRQRFVFELHLKVCRDCRDYLAAYQASMDWTRAATGQQEAEILRNVPDDLVQAIIAARET